MVVGLSQAETYDHNDNGVPSSQSPFGISHPEYGVDQAHIQAHTRPHRSQNNRGDDGVLLRTLLVWVTQINTKQTVRPKQNGK